MIQSTEVRFVWFKARNSEALGNHTPKFTLLRLQATRPVQNENISISHS